MAMGSAWWRLNDVAQTLAHAASGSGIVKLMRKSKWRKRICFPAGGGVAHRTWRRIFGIWRVNGGAQ